MEWTLGTNGIREVTSVKPRGGFTEEMGCELAQTLERQKDRKGILGRGVARGHVRAKAAR